LSANPSDIPAIIQEAYEVLVKANLVEITDSLKAIADTGRRFELHCLAPVPENKEGLPPRALVRVEIPTTFPFHPVQVYSCEETVRGFPHQDAETHKLCLNPDSEVPPDANKLLRYIEWTIDWLNDAAKGTLLKHGDPHELPDFSRKNLRKSLPVQDPLFFVETTESFDHWRDRVGETGKVIIAWPKIPRCLLARRFFNEAGDLIWECPFSAYVIANAEESDARWMLLPDIRYFRARPAQTYGELSELCQAAGIDFEKNLNLTWRQDNQSSKTGLLLVGFPIPVRFGGEASEIHWQPLIIDSVFAEPDNFKLRIDKKHFGRWKKLRTDGKFAFSEQLPWATSMNVAIDRFYARGKFSTALRTRNTMVCGCGAIGSAVAELLARAGVTNLCLVDAEQFQLENQSRHTLDGLRLRHSKAVALAARLSSCNLLSTIEARYVTLPSGDDATERSLIAADLLIDCTANENVFRWLSRFARARQKRFVSLFISFDARFMTICISGKQASCERVAHRLYESIQNGQTPIDSKSYFYVPTKEEQILPGAGCWHPTFPARIDHVWMLTAAALDLLDQVIAAPFGADGTAAVFQRGDAHLIATTENSVERIWTQQYR
jgi:ThiF family